MDVAFSIFVCVIFVWGTQCLAYIRYYYGLAFEASDSRSDL